MSFDELLRHAEAEVVARRDLRAVRYRQEALAMQRGGMRRGLAAFLVRAGARLDRSAVERAVPRRVGRDERVDDALAWSLR